MLVEVEVEVEVEVVLVTVGTKGDLSSVKLRVQRIIKEK